MLGLETFKKFGGVSKSEYNSSMSKIRISCVNCLLQPYSNYYAETNNFSRPVENHDQKLKGKLNSEQTCIFLSFLRFKEVNFTRFNVETFPKTVFLKLRRINCPDFSKCGRS